MVTQERLRQVLSYDPGTGVFTRLHRASSRAPAGSVAGYIDPSHGYRSIGIDGREYYAHRLAWFYMTGEWPPEQIDHINRDRADNRFSNLRSVRQSDNNKNTGIRSNNTSGAKGVIWHKKAGKWMAQIAANGKHYYLGLFDDINDASEAYKAAANELHGAFVGSN